MSIQTAIVEDNKTFAKSLVKILEITEGFSCSAVFHSTEECLESLKAETFPTVDVVLLDLQLPGKNGLTLVPILRNTLPKTEILVLTQNNDYLTTLEAIRLGVAGYILKRSSIEEICDAIEEIHAGGSVIDPQLSRLVLQTINGASFKDENPLSDREKEVLELLAMGFVKKEISDKLNLSYGTVAQYTERIYQKLQVPNVAAAVATAIRKGLI